jgi:peptidoglycan-associated lipoprotein
MNGKKLHRTVFGGVGGLLLVMACGSEPKPAPRAAETPVQQAAPPPPPVVPAAKRQVSSSLVVSEDIRSTCGIAEPKTYFAYKSAALRRQDHTVLRQLAQCITRGPLHQRALQLVGHADPRGGEQYNYQLGQSRANSVKTAMLGMGVAAGQVSTSSRGKLDASGSNEAGWARDRRVEVSLAN